MVEQGTHKPKVVGSKPTLAIALYMPVYMHLTPIYAGIQFLRVLWFYNNPVSPFYP